MSKDRLYLNAQCYSFLSGLVRQISHGLRNPDNQGAERLDALEGVFAKACLRDDISLNLVDAKRFKLPNHLEKLQEAYLASLEENRWLVSGHRLYPIVEVATSVETQLPKSRKLFRSLRARDKMQGITRAIAVAEDNIGRTEDRIAALWFLSGIWGGNSWPEADAQGAYDRAYAGLWRRRNQFYSDLMRLALVQGDLETLDKVRKEIAQVYFAPNTSVMNYLEIDGGHPGRWLQADEDRLRADVQSGLSAPLTDKVH